MDSIYRGAEISIITAAGEDEDSGLHGVGATRRKKQQVIELEGFTIFCTVPDPKFEMMKSRWNRRAWTFQEYLLSRRHLIFTEHQAW